MMKETKIRAIGVSDWRTYRNLRLLSLQESPDAFCATYEHELKLSDDVWRSRCQTADKSKNILLLLAELDGKPCGLSRSIINNDDATTANIYQMWVSPKARGSGIGRSLLMHIKSWAQEHGVSKLALGVTTTNKSAITLYKSIGFVPTGEPEPMRESSHLKVQFMELNLNHSTPQDLL